MRVFGGEGRSQRARQGGQAAEAAIRAQVRPPPPGTKRWDYLWLLGDRETKTLRSNDGRDWPYGFDRQVVAALGAEGWELVAPAAPPDILHGYAYIFKRPAAPEPCGPPDR